VIEFANTWAQYSP